jgi:hypothetical protein
MTVAAGLPGAAASRLTLAMLHCTRGGKLLQDRARPMALPGAYPPANTNDRTVHFMRLSERTRQEWLGNPRVEILAGLVVALALIPEAIAFSIIAGVDPRVGLYASFSIAVLTAIVGGRPGMISAATAATAVLMVTLVRDHGLEYLLAATVLAGLIQIAARAGIPGCVGSSRLDDAGADADLHGASADLPLRLRRRRSCAMRRPGRDRGRRQAPVR